MHLAPHLAAALLIPLPHVLAAYDLVREYSGSSFFSGWDFYGNYDNLTNGDVNWVTQANATQSKLAYVDDSGHAIIKVDNTTFVPYNYKRDTVRITTTDYFAVGSVIVFDANHLPYGCSVWPAFWTKGENWPIGGEIDIIEGVNLMTYNQMALHAQTGCTKATSVTQSGTTGGTNCTDGSGCTVAENQSNSYGASFANAGGGVWATQFDESGIYIWFWSRSSVPSSVSSASSSIDTSSWGTPSASYPASSCNITEFFTPQQLVIDITLCGDWAGVASVYQATCGGDGTATACYLDNVINNGTNYTYAYFDINYVKVFSLTDGVLVPSTSGGSTVLVTQTGSAAGASGSSTATGSSGQSGGNAAVAGVVSAGSYVAAVGATVLAAVSWMLL